MDETHKKLNLIIEALQDYKKGSLSAFACLVVIQLIVTPQPKPPKKLIKKWEKMLKNI